MKAIILRLFLGTIVFLAMSSLEAQTSLTFTEGNIHFREALDLYDKEKFGPAQERLNLAMNDIADQQSEVRVDAQYYAALCAIELFHQDAAALLKKFIEQHPESKRIASARFNLAKFMFRKKKYKEVVKQLAAVDPYDLNEAEKAEYQFKMGYSYFRMDEKEKAIKYLYEIVDQDTRYTTAARYYYGHISYEKGNLETAARSFKRISNDQQFGPIVPYYLTQIFYLQKKYDSLLAYAPAVLDSAPPKREEEIKRLIGDAYYKKGEYEKAVPYLEDYLKRNARAEEPYHYQLGFAHYKAGDCAKAVPSLERSIGANDTLSQSAYYTIGECQVKLNNKRAAREAFRNTYRLGISEQITEDALFNYAKTAYELSYHPYDDAIRAFEEYINSYPKSTRINDAYEYLVGVYYTTKNYKEALRSLDRIKDKNYQLLEARQRLAYFRAIELFNARDYKAAIEHFELSQKNPIDKQIQVASIFWKAEAHYRLKDYDNAIGDYQTYLSTPGALSMKEYDLGFYNIAYAFYEKKNYNSAIFWFREYVDRLKEKKTVLINDALLRIGDSYFINKKYRDATQFYDKAAFMGLVDHDYAVYQSAIANGVLGDNDEKAILLQTLINNNDKSLYLDDAVFELGETYYLKLGDENKGLKYFRQLVADFPNSSYQAAANLKIGLIHYNRNEDDDALVAFDQVIKDFPDSKEAREALLKVEKIFVSKGDVNGLEKYVKGVPFADISKSRLDSTAYGIAENHFLSGDCDKATKDFTNYLNKYSNGIFKLNAHFYRAECENSAGFQQEALIDYRYVLDRPHSKFTEKALARAGDLYVAIGDEDNAIATFLRLEQAAERKENVLKAQLNLMQIYFNKDSIQSAVGYAMAVLSENKLEPKLANQAKLIIAKSAFEEEDYDNALTHLDSLSQLTNSYGAESKYLLAQIQYLKGEYKECETTIYRLVDQVPSYPYWIGKGFILMADNFIAQEDFYNAKITFQSVIDNADDEELVQIAQEKLAILSKMEEEQKEAGKDKGVEIDLNEGNQKDQGLFDNDEPNTPSDTLK